MGHLVPLSGTHGANGLGSSTPSGIDYWPVNGSWPNIERTGALAQGCTSFFSFSEEALR